MGSTWYPPWLPKEPRGKRADREAPLLGGLRTRRVNLLAHPPTTACAGSSNRFVPRVNNRLQPELQAPISTTIGV